MDFKQYTARFEAFVAELRKTRPDNVRLIAFDGLALAKNRVIRTGVGASGRAFSDYSPGYAEIREERGRTTAYKNFSFTGEMMKNTVPVIERNTKDVTVIGIDGSTQRARDLLVWHSNREGEFILGLNAREMELINELNEERINNLLDKYGLL